MIALLASSAWATVDAPVQVCFRYQMNWNSADNAGGSGMAVAPGDYWNDNDETQPVLYHWVSIESSHAGKEVRLNGQGCVDETIPVDAWGDLIEVTLLPRARVRNVDIEWRHRHAVVDPKNSKTDAGLWTQSVPPDGLAFEIPANPWYSTTIEVPAQNGWQYLAVVTWMIMRHTHMLRAPMARECCVASDAGVDGLCTSSAGTSYDEARVQVPYLFNYPLIAIRTHDGGNCCGSSINWTARGDTRAGLHFSVNGSPINFNRWPIAHETAHAFANLRIVGREPVDLGADTNGCNGRWEIDGDGDASLVADDKDRSWQKEYWAVSAREGWADFVSAWTWNDRNTTSAEVVTSNSIRYADFDMNTPGMFNPTIDFDNKCFSSTTQPYTTCDWQWDYVYRVNGPTVAGPTPPGSTPLEPWAANFTKNWLAAAQQNVAVCGPVEPTQCVSPSRAPDMESYNRTTVPDFARMMWALHSTQQVNLGGLSNLYTGMCPRSWRTEDGAFCPMGDDLPYRRLLDSASDLGFSTELASEIDHVVH